mgnify:FL=1
MKRKTKSIGLCLLLVLALLFCSCQTSAVKEEQASADPTVTAAAKDSADDGNTKDSSEVKEDNNDKEPEYIDEEYVDEHYGSDEEKEDLSKYKKKSSSSKKSDSKNSDSKNSDTEDADGTESNGTNGNGSTSSGEEASEDNYYTDPIPEGKPDPVEPQDQTVDSSKQLTCTLYVECSTILNNMGDLTEGKEGWVPSNGVIYGPKTVTFSEGESVYDILQREMKNNRIQMESEFTAMYNSAYVQGINNLYEKDCGQWSGWMYEVNGWYPNYGCSRYQVQDGDNIEWHYTCDLGRDLGAGMS